MGERAEPENNMNDPAASFRESERALLAAHGLEARELFFNFSAPALRARALELGTGAPLLYVHGGGGFGSLWAPLVAALPGRRHLLLDRPGCGLSEASPISGGLRKHAVDFLTAAFDGLQLGKVDVVANSMGGLWSLWFALAHPERVRTLTLIGAPAMVGGGSAPLPLRLLGRPMIGALMMKLEPPSPKQVRVLWGRMGHDPSKLDSSIHDAMLAVQQVPAYAGAWRALLGAALSLSGPADGVAFADADLGRLSCPVSWIWGTHDPFGDAELGRAAAQKTPRSRFSVVGVGHLPWLDAPADCARAVVEGLAGRSEAAA
jgi:pimeloyl-ACP methyl ester carboxylesterase